MQLAVVGRGHLAVLSLQTRADHPGPTLSQRTRADDDPARSTFEPLEPMPRGRVR